MKVTHILAANIVNVSMAEWIQPTVRSGRPGGSITRHNLLHSQLIYCFNILVPPHHSCFAGTPASSSDTGWVAARSLKCRFSQQMEQEGGSMQYGFSSENWRMRKSSLNVPSMQLNAVTRNLNANVFFRQLQQRIECLQDNYNTGSRNAFLNVSIFVTIVWFLPSSNVHF